MKLRVLALLFLIPALTYAQGKYATGLMKNLVGKQFTDSVNLPALKGYQFRHGALISPYKDSNRIVAAVYQKGSTVVAIVSYLKDSSKKIYQVLDVLEIKNVEKSWQLRTALCRLNQLDDTEIFALAKKGKGDYLDEVKLAWRFSLKYRFFQSMDVKGIDCFNEGGD